MGTHLPSGRHVAMICLTVAAIQLGGCGSIPDLKGFADATGDMRAGITTVGNEFAQSIPSDLNTCGDTSCRAKFEDVWKSRIEAMGAIADYSDSLAQIAAAGKDGAATAEKVLGSANGLLGALSVSTIPAAVATAATKALAELANYRALKSMGEAIEAAQKPIEGVVNVLEQDLAVLDRTLSDISIGVIALEENKDKLQAGAAVAQAELSIKEYLRLISNDYSSLRSNSMNLAAVRAGSARPVQSGCDKEETCVTAIRAVDLRLTANREQLAKLQRDLEGFEKSYAPVKASKDAVAARISTIRKGIVHLRSGLRDWIVVHGALGNDVRRSLQPNVRQLVATAADLRKLIDDMRKAQ